MKKNLKLCLNRETLRDLVPAGHLSHIQGGSGSNDCGQTVYCSKSCEFACFTTPTVTCA